MIGVYIYHTFPCCCGLHKANRTALDACQVVSGRLFSEGLHVLGRAPGEPQMAQYLSAFFGNDLPEQVRANRS